MATPSWTKNLSEVLMQNTVMVTKKSSNGNEYQQEIVKRLEVVSTGSVEQANNGGYNYSIVDIEHQLEYTVKAPELVDVVFGTKLVFTNVFGGTTNSGRGWYKAEEVSVAK